MGLLEQADFGVFKEKATWQAFVIAVVMFGTISFAALSMFDSMDELFQSDAEPAPIPNLVFESLNRSNVEAGLVNETGWFNLDDHRGSIIILDLMARDCSNCHLVQEHLEQNMDDWKSTADASGKSLKIFAYGAWYGESVEYLSESGGEYTVPLYPTGFGSVNAAVLENGSTTDPVRLFTTGGTGQIPVVLIIDEEGYIIAQQATGTPTDKWSKFDGTLETALTSNVSETFDSRIGWEEPSTSFTAVFVLGLILSILVYFSLPFLGGTRGRAHRRGENQNSNAEFIQHWRPLWLGNVDLLRHHRHRCASHGGSLCEIRDHPLHCDFHRHSPHRVGFNDAFGYHLPRHGIRSEMG